MNPAEKRVAFLPLVKKNMTSSRDICYLSHLGGHGLDWSHEGPSVTSLHSLVPFS